MSAAPQAPVSAPQRLRIRYGDETIAFEVRAQAGRTRQALSIHVEPDGRVLVDAPPHTDVARLLDGVRRRAQWISQQLAGFRALRAHALPQDYVSGETLLYLGRRYRLKVVIDPALAPSVCMRGARIELTVPVREPALLGRTLAAWYRQRAREFFAARLAVVAQPLRWVQVPPPVRLQFMKVQWGSCSPSGRLTLNPWLVRAPREAVDYVLLHELCHLRHHNHSRAFYTLLDRHMPDWRQVKARLDGRAQELLRH